MQKMFSRIPLMLKVFDSPTVDSDMKKSHLKGNNYLKSNDVHNIIPFDSSSYGLFSEFCPPPPRIPSDDMKDILSDGITSCDLCSWASIYNEKNYFSFEGYEETSRDISWIILLFSVSCLSALFGAVLMVTLLRYRRNGSVGAFMFEKTVSPENIENIQNKSGKHELKKIDGSSNVDLTFFMEQEEDLYATLNDHDSISSENINSFNKTTYMRNDETDIPFFSSAPSSAYYSDLSNHLEKPYENIETFNMERTDININRLSAISENNSGSRNNSEYV